VPTPLVISFTRSNDFNGLRISPYRCLPFRQPGAVHAGVAPDRAWPQAIAARGLAVRPPAGGRRPRRRRRCQVAGNLTADDL